jgi:hypothetical protein
MREWFAAAAALAVVRCPPAVCAQDFLAGGWLVALTERMEPIGSCARNPARDAPPCGKRVCA